MATKYIGYLSTGEFIFGDVVNHEACCEVITPNLHITKEGAAKLREILGVPDVTAEEAEVVALERELEAAVGDCIFRVDHHFGGAGHWYTLDVPKRGVIYLGPGKPTRSNAARKAVNFVRSLRQPKLPDVMSFNALVNEMGERGYELITACGTMCWDRARDHHKIFMDARENTRALHVRAVKSARERDAKQHQP